MHKSRDGVNFCLGFVDDCWRCAAVRVDLTFANFVYCAKKCGNIFVAAAGVVNDARRVDSLFKMECKYEL